MVKPDDLSDRLRRNGHPAAQNGPQAVIRFLPRLAPTFDEVIAQPGKHGKQMQSSIDGAYQRQTFRTPF